MWNGRLNEAQAGIKISRRNINNLRYTDDTYIAESEEELKSFLMKAKEEREQADWSRKRKRRVEKLKELNFQKTKTMASGPISSVQFSCSIMSDSLWPHGLQQARLPCPSPTPGACSNSCPSSWWCQKTISASVVRFSSCLQSFQASGYFQMSQLFTSAG